jgi:hypothetical protein
VKCERQHRGEPPDAVARVQVKSSRTGRVLMDHLVCQEHLDMEQRTAQIGMADVAILPTTVCDCS